MSNAVRFDPLLVRHLADELRERLQDRGCAALPAYGADRSVALALDGGEELRIDLHPNRGFIRIRSSAGRSPEIDSVLEDVSTEVDERIIRFRLREAARFRSAHRTLIIELQTNRWNAILLGDDERIASVLNSRRSGGRTLVAGATYERPPGRPRLGPPAIDREAAKSVWQELITLAPANERMARLSSHFAYTGPINGAWILHGGEHEFDATAAFERWWWIAEIPTRSPRVLTLDGRLQPYSVPLEGIPSDPCPTLLAAMDCVADAVALPSPSDPALDRASAIAEFRMIAARQKLEGLKRQLLKAGGSERLRALGDLLLARIQEVRRGDTMARIADWDGGVVEIGLDPTLTPAENAARYYEKARRRQRAEEELPAMIAAAEKELAEWEAVAAAVSAGEIPSGLAKEAQDTPKSGRGTGRSTAPVPALPYRTFRTSGGLEVRVGRGAKENDRLTFRESAPNDVWLHAHTVPGSHVILRWTNATSSPPARDLQEAAQLAAVFSRARTSSTVAVIWTRRKYVRKPRGAPPGRVVTERVNTLFVEPDESIVDRLAVRRPSPE